MGGLRSRILRTFQSFPNVAAVAQSSYTNLLTNAGPSPLPSPCAVQEPALGVGRGTVLDLPSISACSEGDGAGEESDAGKENVVREITPRRAKKMRISSEEQQDGCPRNDLEAPPYHRPDPASATLFDPDLLLEFRRAVVAYNRALEESKRRDDTVQEDWSEPPAEASRVSGDSEGPLASFESKCPPGGERVVVLYTTTLRGVRKTFEDCNRARLLLESLRVAFLERDVSMHAGYRDELRALLGRAAVPPRLFVEGRYVGGADDVVGLHERSRLRPMLRHLPARAADAGSCAACGGARFLVCGACSGSHRLYDGAGRVPCAGCNENGLVPCPLCS